MISFANRNGTQSSYNDFSAGKAIQTLKNKKDACVKVQTQISGKEMSETIEKAILDADNHAASMEYIDLKKFVTENDYRMSPEAKNAFNVYERYVQNAQAQGKAGLTPLEIKHLLYDMQVSKPFNPTIIPFNDSNNLLGGTNNLPQYNLVGTDNPIVPSNNGYVPSFPGSNLSGQSPVWAPTTGVAASETAKVWGDPHFVDPDGGRFDVQGQAGHTYNMLDDTNLNFNARFDDAGKGTTVIGQTGITLQGMRGVSQIQFSKDGTATINGQRIQPGIMETLADGGHALLSDDGKTLTIKTGEGYNITQRLVDGRIDADVVSPALGVATEGRMPGGLLGQTFDADKIARNSNGHQGEGAIAGNVNNYEVQGGVFGAGLSGQAVNNSGLINGFNSIYNGIQNSGISNNFINPGLNSAATNYATPTIPLRDQSLDFAISQNQRTAQQQSINENNSKTDKLMQQLLLALQSGNIDLAMLLFSGIESKESSQMIGMLTQKMVQLQQSRKQMMMQMDQNQNQQAQAQGQNAGQNGANPTPPPQSNTSTLQANVQEVNDSIQILSSFIKEINEQKNRVSEFSNNYLSTEHQTSMSIVRGMR